MKILHTMLRVGDLDRSISFYTDILGMKLKRTTDRPEQKYTLAFVGYGDESEHAVLELTYNYGVGRYELGGGAFLFQLIAGATSAASAKVCWFGGISKAFDDSKPSIAEERSRGGLVRSSGPAA